MMSKEIQLNVKNLRKNYSGKAVVDDLSFFVNKGEIVGLLGPNGAGKTTAFYMTIGLISVDSGEVIFENQNVTHIPMHLRARMGMGYLAQEPSVFRHLSVEDNILCILQRLELSKAQKENRLEELLQELHLTHLRKKIAVTLSGGERRRLEITRALVTSPKFLLLDEPFANIDPISVKELKDLIKLLIRKDISVLITDHNAREIFSIVDRGYIIREGRVLLSGSVDELINSPDAKKHYLGEGFTL